jgi:Tol biopolymer transport system component
VQLQWVSPDGKSVIFVTPSALLDGDQNGGPDLYLYRDGPDPASESNLTMVTNSGNVAEATPEGGAGVIGGSEDASRVYYSLGDRIFLWENGITKLIATDVISGPMFENFPAIARGPGAARVSADGRRLAFIEGRKMEGESRTMNLYDAERDSLSCLSCTDHAGNPAVGSVSLKPEASETSPVLALNFRPRFLSADGRRTFFSSPDPLVARDTNGTFDVYLYDAETGELSMLSPGDTESGVWLGDASASGDDVFMVTAARLVGTDTDGLIDLYDARVGGGFPEPPPGAAPCEGDSCRGPASTAPPEVAPRTPTFVGPATRRCRRQAQHERKHGKHRRRCQKKPRHGKRHHSQGGSRKSQGGER